MSKDEVVEKESAGGEKSEQCGSLDDEHDVMTESFNWFSSAAEGRLRILKDDLKKADEPSWDNRLAVTALDWAIEIGAVVCAEYLAVRAAALAAKRIVKAATHKDSVENFTKEMFKAGIKAGAKAGVEAMNAHEGVATPDRFIEGQIEGVKGLASASQRHYLRVGRHQITTAADACALSESCSEVAMKEAAQKQVDTSRDAWVRYLAQSKLGTFRRNKDAPLTTNMTDDATRARVNDGSPGVVPADGPDLLKVARGAQPGVLGLFVKVPFNDRAGRRNGDPIVTYACLAGVNDTVRREYGNRPLEEVHIPVRVEVEAGEGWIKRFPRFTINLDETGQAMSISPAGRRWLIDYHREVSPNSTLSDDAAEADSLKQLVSQLYVHDIRRPLP